MSHRLQINRDNRFDKEMEKKKKKKKKGRDHLSEQMRMTRWLFASGDGLGAMHAETKTSLNSLSPISAYFILITTLIQIVLACCCGFVLIFHEDAQKEIPTFSMKKKSVVFVPGKRRTATNTSLISCILSLAVAADTQITSTNC